MEKLLSKKQALKRAGVYGVKRLLTVSQPKTMLSETIGVLTAPLMLAPSKSAYAILKAIGLTLDASIFKNICPWATRACLALCLGPHSGRGRMLSAMVARARRTWFYHAEPIAFKALLYHELAAFEKRAKKLGMLAAARLDTVSDMGLAQEFLALFPNIMFYDYTANIERVRAWAKNRDSTPNYYLTFSAKERNKAEYREALGLGVNVAMCIAYEKDEGIPRSIEGFLTYDADSHDYRPIDPRAKIGLIGVLKPKGSKAKNDLLGFTRQHDKRALFMVNDKPRFMLAA